MNDWHLPPGEDSESSTPGIQHTWVHMMGNPLHPDSFPHLQHSIPQTWTKVRHLLTSSDSPAGLTMESNPSSWVSQVLYAGVECVLGGTPPHAVLYSHHIGPGFWPTPLLKFQFSSVMSSVHFSHSVVSDSLQPHGPQHARPPYPLPTPGVVHWVGEAVQPSHPLLSPSPPAFNFPQNQGLFKKSTLWWVLCPKCQPPWCSAQHP